MSGHNHYRVSRGVYFCPTHLHLLIMYDEFVQVEPLYEGETEQSWAARVGRCCLSAFMLAYPTVPIREALIYGSAAGHEGLEIENVADLGVPWNEEHMLLEARRAANHEQN